MEEKKRGPGPVTIEELIFSEFTELFHRQFAPISSGEQEVLGDLWKLLRCAGFVRRGVLKSEPSPGWWAVDGAYVTFSFLQSSGAISVAVSAGFDENGEVVYSCDSRGSKPFHGVFIGNDATDVSVHMLISEMQLALDKLGGGAEGVILDGSAYGFIRRVQMAEKRSMGRATALFRKLFEESLKGRVVWVPKDISSKPLLAFIERFLLSVKEGEPIGFGGECGEVWGREHRACAERVYTRLFEDDAQEGVESRWHLFRDTYLAGLILSYGVSGGSEEGVSRLDDYRYWLLGPIDILAGSGDFAKDVAQMLPENSTYAAFYIWMHRWVGWPYAVRVEVVMKQEDAERPLPPRDDARGDAVKRALRSVVATMGEDPRDTLVLVADEFAKNIVVNVKNLIVSETAGLGSPRGEEMPTSRIGGV